MTALCRIASMSKPELTFAAQLTADHLPPFEREYRFHVERKYRFDFAWPHLLLAVELEGGIWTGGAHSRPLGILRDMEKSNLAVMCGWSVLRFSSAQIAKGVGLAMVKEWMEARSVVIR